MTEINQGDILQHKRTNKHYRVMEVRERNSIVKGAPMPYSAYILESVDKQWKRTVNEYQLEKDYQKVGN